jgi:hypothetical protein
MGSIDVIQGGATGGTGGTVKDGVPAGTPFGPSSTNPLPATTNAPHYTNGTDGVSPREAAGNIPPDGASEVDNSYSNNTDGVSPRESMGNIPGGVDMSCAPNNTNGVSPREAAGNIPPDGAREVDNSNSNNTDGVSPREQNGNGATNTPLDSNASDGEVNYGGDGYSTGNSEGD